MCSQPYIKTPVGIRKVDTFLSQDARLAATPFPCGQCLHCRINKRRVWTARILLEELASDFSCFVTLTYDQDNLPDGGCLDARALQLYLKRLRKAVSPRKFRHYSVGEYGDKSGRPHYHLALFGIGQESRFEIKKCWPFGIVHIGELNKNTAQYIAGYVTKKWTNPKTPELEGRPAEFMRCSKQKGGIGTPGIKRIAKTLMEHPHFQKRQLKEVRYGKKSLPLGRYLSQRLAALLFLEKSQLDDDFWMYQKQLFDDHLKDGEVFLDNLLAAKKGSRIRQERRSQIFKDRRQI